MILEVEKNGKKKPKLKKTAESDGGSPKAAPAAAKKKTAKDKPYVLIDFPKEGELILEPNHYAVRVGASSGPVEISIDGSPWAACREAGSYFWHDWRSISSGPHKLVARIAAPGGKEKKSKATQCKAK